MDKHMIAIPMGDPAGVGPEIVLKALSEDRDRYNGIPVITGDISVLNALKDKLSIPIELKSVSDTDNIALETIEVPVFDTGMINEAKDIEPGVVTPLAGKAAVSYIKKAVELCKEGKTLGIATPPINKEALRAAGFHYIGHTEMLAEMFEVEKSYTMFMIDRLRILFHTRHLSLLDAIRSLDTEEVFQSIETAQKCLRSIGEEAGKIALAALNPHASDGGLFGNEERDILEPAVKMAQQKGIPAVGPIPADSVFYFALEGKFDAVVSLFHDQGHIASKTYDFYRTVSVTFGLPFIRTSVDHGTAYDIAWKGIANPISMEEAIKACFDLAPRYRPFS